MTNTDKSRRQAFQRILGIGAGLVTTSLLLPEFGRAARCSPPGGEHRSIAAPHLPVVGVYNVRAMGAAGDGRTVDTPAINKAIEAAARAGGGTVLFPAGTYLC